MFVRKKLLVAGILMSVILVSCAPGEATQEGVSQEDINLIMTAGVGTFAASIFQTQTALVPPPTQTQLPSPTSSAGSSTPQPTIASPTQGFVFIPVGTVSISPTPTVTGTQKAPTVNPSSLAFGCNNLLLIRDETIPAGTVMKPNQVFTKTWKVENNGTCDWVFRYRLVHFGGEKMDGDPAGLGKVIEPYKWTQLSVNLTAPKHPGSYVGYWRFGDQSGNMFGSTLTVSIVVAQPTNTPGPTKTPAPTGTPTSTPLPSDTPVPTNTDLPTDTPVP